MMRPIPNVLHYTDMANEDKLTPHYALFFPSFGLVDESLGRDTLPTALAPNSLAQEEAGVSLLTVPIAQMRRDS